MVSEATSERRSLRTTAADKFFIEDLHDIFATLINSLTLHPSKHFFKTIENTFTTEEAIQDLSSLRLCQTNRTWDLNNKPIITSTTTTYSMEYEAAMSICQQCMDARLLENAVEPASGIFKPRGIWVLTPKGLHILERFVTTNGMETEDLQSVFTLQPILIKMLHLERHPNTNEIVISNQVIIALFKRFAGRQPNYTSSNKDSQSSVDQNVFRDYYERYKGIPLSDGQDKSSALFGKKSATHRMCFGAVEALTWLTDFTSIGARDEAAVMAAHFVRFGFIALAIERSKTESVTVTVRGAPSHGKGFTAQTGEFRCANKTLYKITELGAKVLGWDDQISYTTSPHASQSNLVSPYPSPVVRPKNLQRRLSTANDVQNITHEHRSDAAVKESNTERLQYILDSPALLSLFREYLVSTLCDENLSFFLDVEDLKRKYRTSSSAPKPSQESRSTVDMHRENLAGMAWHVHAQYLAPSSPCELNIDHTLRNEIGVRMDKVFENRPRDPAHTTPAQIQDMIGLYNRIQQHVFRMMASDSVPKFTDTPRFQHHRREAGDLDVNLFGEHGAIHETISLQAAEQQARSPHFVA